MLVLTGVADQARCSALPPPVTTTGSPHGIRFLVSTAMDVGEGTLVRMETRLLNCSPGTPVCWPRHSVHTADGDFRALLLDPGVITECAF